MARRALQPQLITTKLEPPALPRREALRPRVTKLLTFASERPFVLVTGPPGIGKTVAMLQWLTSESDGRRVAWLSLDPGDHTPLRFWRYLVASFSSAGIADLGETAEVALETGAMSDDVAESFVNEVRSIPSPALLVLDDLHVVESAQILRQLEVVIEHLPPTLQIVATSRTEPALPLGRWRTRGKLGQVHHGDLAFRPDEVSEYLATFEGLKLSDADVEHVAARTEGWVVAIQMMALAALDASDPRSAVWSLTSEDMAIASFLSTELLDRQRDEVRAFLLDTSILTVLDASLCNAVTERTDSRTMLKELEAANLFVTRLRGRGQYRYHQLFAEVLRAELEAEDPDATRRRSLHRRAAAYLGATDDVAGQVQHLLAAGDRDAAFEVAVAPAMELWDRGEADPAVLESLDLFPPTFVEAEPSRVVPYLIALGAASKWERITPWLTLAEQRCSPLDVDVVRMTLDLIAGNGSGALRAAERASAHDAGDGLLGDRRLQSRLVPHVARAYLLVDDVDGARDAFGGVELADSIAGGVVGPAVRARVAHRVGELSRALQLANEAFTAAQELGVPHHFALIDARLARAGVYLDRNQLCDADVELEAVFDLAEQRRTPGYQVLAHLLQARVAAARHRAADAIAVLAIAQRRVELRCSGDDLSRLIAGLEARMCCELGDLDRAADLLDLLPSGPTRSLLAARIALGAGDAQGALEVLEQAVLPTTRDRVEALLIRERAEITNGASGTQPIELAVAIAAPMGFVRPFLDEGPGVVRRARAVAAAASNGRARGFAESLTAAGLVTEVTSVVEPLTSRERQVLQYLPRPLTNEEIAAELYVSLNTVKTHLKGVYRKLGASSRAEVVARARSLGLL